MTKLSELVARIVRHNSLARRRRGSTLKRFSEKLGLIYFGSVDQHKDEHDPIRGLTVSTTHRDYHYALGSYDGRDIALADRYDIILDQQGHHQEHNWLILQIDMQTAFPHAFFLPSHAKAIYARLFEATSSLQPVNTAFAHAQHEEFRQRYELYAAPTHVQELESRLSRDTILGLAVQFWPHALELRDSKLYVYITEKTLSESLLQRTIESGLWLAQSLEAAEA